MINKRIIGAQNNAWLIAKDGTVKYIDMHRISRLLKTRKIYEKQRALCGAIKIQWQRSLGK